MTRCSSSTVRVAAPTSELNMAIGTSHVRRPTNGQKGRNARLACRTNHLFGCADPHLTNATQRNARNGTDSDASRSEAPFEQVSAWCGTARDERALTAPAMWSRRDDVLSFLDSLDSYSSPSASKTTPASTAPPTIGVVTGPPSAAATSAAPPVASAEEAQSVLDFLDELTQRSSTPTATVKAADGGLGLAKKPSYPGGLSRSASKSNIAASGARKSGESTRSRSSVEVANSAERESTPVQDQAQDQGGWGWSSVWNQASSVVQQASVMAQQARTVAEEQVKTASTNAAGLAGGIEGLRGGVMKALGENEQAKKWSEGVIEYARGAHLDQLGASSRFNRCSVGSSQY